MNRKTLLLAFGICALYSTSALAEDCGGLKRVASVQMETPHDRRVIIPVTINGQERHFLFDTGGAAPQISATAADELKLGRHDSHIKLLDAGGNASDQAVFAETFSIGALTGKDLELQVSPGGGRGGVITPAVFAGMDIDMDFGPGRLNLFLDDHCPGRVVYWKADVATVVPMQLHNRHINVPVTVDGHELPAIIDTGATGTFMDMDVAKRVFGLTPESPGMTPNGFANNDPGLPLYSHVFPTLSLGGVTVNNARVEIMPDRVGSKDRENGLQTGSFIRKADDNLDNPAVTVGMNVLSKLHIYAAMRERNLYITPAGAPDAPSPFGAAAH